MRNYLREEFFVFLSSLSFFTRIPIKLAPDKFKANTVMRYFGIIGLLIGSISALSFFLVALIWPKNVAIVAAIITATYLTGALHEDGLADTIDGFGGGYDCIAKLKIMHDPCIGTFGALALVFSILLKFTLLSSSEHVIAVLICAHGISRSFTAAIMHSLNYVKLEQSTTKSQAITKSQSIRDYLVLSTTAIAIFVWLPNDLAIYLLLGCAFLKLGLLKWFKHHLNGYSGDCLGAAQQIFEIFCYLLLSLNFWW